MGYVSRHWIEYPRLSHLCTDFQHVLERHASICQLALEEHDDIVIVLFQLFALGRLRALRLALLDICLQLSNLFVDVRNVLLDDERQFLCNRLELHSV